MDFANSGLDQGLRYRGNVSHLQPPQKQQQQQQQQHQRAPPPKASMSMGYMPVLVDETNLLLGGGKSVDAAAVAASKPPQRSLVPVSSTATTLASTSTDTANLAIEATTATAASRWVLVTGYVTKAHYDLIKSQFCLLGNVVNYRGVCHEGRTNWIAFQYETRLEAEDALSLGTFPLVDGIWISVSVVTPQLLATLDVVNKNFNYSTSSLFSMSNQLQQQQLQNDGILGASGSLELVSYRPLDPARLDFSEISSSSGDKYHGATGRYPNNKTWIETEIYLNNHSPNKRQWNATDTSFCERTMNWIFGWND